MNVRLQTWFPYHIQVCMNGREWLRRSLEAAGIEFLRRGNKFFHIEDYAQAQRFLDEQLNCNWTEMLESFLPAAFPTMRETLGEGLRYYWTMWQSEWATDFVFRSPDELSVMADRLLRHAMMTGTGTRILRYLGRPLTLAGTPYKNFNEDVYSRLLEFDEGVRVRHWVGQNSVKAYNEHNILRVEATVNNPKIFHVHRRLEGEGANAPKKLLPLRQGVADIPLRAQVSQEINDRFTDQLATFSDETPLRELLAGVSHGSTRAGRRIRALEPTGKDRELLEAIADPAYSVSGITNKALRERLAKTNWGARRTAKQLSARISRHLRLLRDHGLLRKMPNRRRYHLTEKGRQLTTALTAALAASTQQLMEIAA
jgi:DNA-binding transcriptional ArsR family regulator